MCASDAARPTLDALSSNSGGISSEAKLPKPAWDFNRVFGSNKQDSF
jgi:hypothetical protein